MSMDYCGEFLQSTAAQLTVAVGPPYTTGLTFTVQISKAGAAWSTITPTLTEIGNGVYTFALTTAHTSALGQNVIRLSSTGNDDYFCNFTIVLHNPFIADLTAAQIATGVWQDATAGDFTTASSIGKALYIANIAPGGSGGLLISGSNAGTTTLGALTITGAMSINGTGNVAQTGDSFARIGAAGAGLTAVALTGTQTFNNTGTWTGNIVGTVSTLTTYTGNTPQTGDSYARIGVPVGASISADVAGVPTTVWAAVMTGTTTAIQAMRGFIAAMVGKASGLELNAPKYRNIADTKDVIAATTDANGNRTAVTLDLT